MENVTLDKINKNILILKYELDEIRSFFIENNYEISEDAKQKIVESRTRSISNMKTQNEIEKKFL